MVGDGGSEGDPTFVSERSDDKSRAISKIFIAILEGSIGLFDKAVISFWLPVVSQLLAKLKVI